MDGTPVTLPVLHGRAELPLHAFISFTIGQEPPYLSDAHMRPVTIEVFE